jgi:adenine deaminase
MNYYKYDTNERQHQIAAALGTKKAELVIKNVSYLNVFSGQFELADVAIERGRFVGIGAYEGTEEIDGTGKYMTPGFIDGHMHLESSSVTPKEYAKAVMPHGTTAIVADPHEITNVCGCEGFEYILQATKDLPLDVFVMLPSCVPASIFDENGADFGLAEIMQNYHEERVLGLAEVMNYPGIIAGDENVLNKIKVISEAGGFIDGHAPGLSGKALNAYNTAGIYTDHECSTMEEALEKMRNGEWIMVREGTASRNLLGLLPMFSDQYYNRALLVTDDKHPGDLITDGHIDHIIRTAIKHGAKPENAYKMASYNACMCFGLQHRGAICPGYIADFVLLNDKDSVDIDKVYKNGKLITTQLLVDCQVQVEDRLNMAVRNTVHINTLHASDFDTKGKMLYIIGLIPGELITTDDGMADHVDTVQDIIKLCVVERHKYTGHIGIAYLHGYGLKHGAIATSVAHDSHNIIVAGTNDEDIAMAVMQLREIGGGMVIVDDQKVCDALSFPIAGLMSDMEAMDTQIKMDALKETARKMGVLDGVDPFMSLSFTSLPVIPHLKLTTRGVVDVDQFKLI